MNKILIVGSPGSGKSTLAKILGDTLNLRIVYLDTFYWKAGWITRDHEEYLKLEEEALLGDRWVIDGNYRSTLDKRLSYADTVIFLDYKRWICIFSIFKRFFKYRKQERDSITKGCPEKIDKAFFLWAWRFNKNIRPLIYQKINSCKNVNILIFKNRKSLNRFIKTLDSHK